MNGNVSGPRWGNPTFWVLLALAFGNVFATGDLGLHRPPAEAQSSSPDAHVRSRLWRDPLEVAQAATRAQEPEELAGMATESLAHVRRTLREHLRATRARGEHVLVLPVDLRPGPHSEARENRLRARYAVTTSLLDRLFVPENPEHLELLVQPHEAFGIRHEAAGQAEERADDGHRHGAGQEPAEDVHAWHDAMLTVPYQWFTGSAEAGGSTIGAVLVTWVDEDLLGERPLAIHEGLLEVLLAEVSEHDLARVDVRLIGPTSSDGLVALLREAGERESLYEYGRVRNLSAEEHRSEANTLEATGQARGAGHAVEAAAPAPAGAGAASEVRGLLTTLATNTLTALDGRAKRLLARSPTWSQRIGGLEVLSPWSTAELGDAWPSAPPRGACERHGGAMTGCFLRTGVHVRRLIGKDRWLADSLVRELALRVPGLMPYVRGFSRYGDAAPSLRPALPWHALSEVLNGVHFLDDAKQPEVRVALVAEEDSLYGRSWLETLRDAWRAYERELYGSLPCLPSCGCCAVAAAGPSCSPACFEGHACCKKDAVLPRVRFEHIPFLRGIDGYVVGQEAQASGKDREYPAGNGQIDYLRRLQQVLSGGHDYDAIGVLGTDVYDELIILEALTPLFPDTTFFTTDLDVRFAAPRHLPYSRNLVVASHYGLARRAPATAGQVAKGQVVARRFAHGQAPPLSFRDSYQTSQYEAVAVAVGGKRALPREADGGKHSYLFEIGRHGAVPLSTADTPSLPTLPKPGRLAPVLLSLTLLALAFVALSPVSRYFRRFAEHVSWLSWVLFSVLVGATLACTVFLYHEIDGQLVSGEPFLWAEGVSVWPAVFVRVAGSTFCLLSLLFIAVESRRVQREIERDLLGYRTRTVSIWERAPAKLAVLRDAVGEGLRTRGRSLPAGASELRRRWWRALLRSLRPTQTDVRELWRQRYVFWNHPGWRLFRSMLFTMVFMRLMTPIFQHLGRPGSPVRGEVALLADKGSVFFFVFTLMTLIFYVLDSNWHAIRFLRDHMREGIGEWPAELIERARDLPGAGERSRKVLHELQRRYLSVRLTADLTQVVQSFVYLPAVGVCILLASRLNVFDRWAWPSALVFAFALILGFLIVCAWNLSLAGRAVKEQSIRLLQDLRQEAGDDRKTREMIDERITELESLRGGAFSPLTQHPLVRAALLPIAFLGSGSMLTYWGLLAGS